MLLVHQIQWWNITRSKVTTENTAVLVTCYTGYLIWEMQLQSITGIKINLPVNTFLQVFSPCSARSMGAVLRAKSANCFQGEWRGQALCLLKLYHTQL